MNGSTASSGSTVCVCTWQRLKWYGCLCGAEMERERRLKAEQPKSDPGEPKVDR